MSETKVSILSFWSFSWHLMAPGAWGRDLQPLFSLRPGRQGQCHVKLRGRTWIQWGGCWTERDFIGDFMGRHFRRD